MAMPGLVVRRIETTSDFESLRDAWNRLFERCPHQSTFLTWEWLFTWWKFYSTGRRLSIFTVWEGGELVGIAPLKIARRKKKYLWYRILGNLGKPHADIAGFLVDHGRFDVMAQICAAIAGSSAEWDVFELEEAPLAEHGLIPILSGLTAHQCVYRLIPTRHLHIHTVGDFRLYYEGLPKRLRKQIRKSIERLKGEGVSVSYRRFVGDEVKPEHLQAIFEINAKGTFPELYQDEITRRFHLELAKTLTSQAVMDISFLYFNEQPVAFDYGFRINQRFEDWRGGYDKTYADYGPGNILFLHLIENNFNSRLREIDFLRGDEEYKLRWQVTEHPHAVLQVVPPRRILAHASYIWLPALKKKVIEWTTRQEKPQQAELVEPIS